MNNVVNVVSLFDGISCGRVAFEEVGIKIGSYHAFEIDKYAKAISKYNYPEIIQHGDVFNADFSKFIGADFVIGGSPCTFWSIAKKDREIDKNGMGWKLFMKFIEAIKIIKPKWFLYENVASMPKNIKSYISEELGVEPILINSALVSAQQRKRLYWTNITDISQPEDKGILLKDILESGESYINKSHCLVATYGGAEIKNSLSRKQRTMVFEHVTTKDYKDVNEDSYVGAALRTRKDKIGSFKRLEVRSDSKINSLTTVQTDSVVCSPVRIGQYGKGSQGKRIYSVYGKTICLCAGGGGQGGGTGLYKIDLPDGNYSVRKLTPIETEYCQTLPYNYTAFGLDDKEKIIKISNTQRYKCVGNGWTIQVIAHILKHIKNELILSNQEPKGSFLCKKLKEEILWNFSKKQLMFFKFLLLHLVLDWAFGDLLTCLKAMEMIIPEQSLKG